MIRAAWLCLVLVGCAHAPPPDVDHVAGDGYEGVIFSARFAERQLGTRTRTWTPSRAMVAAFERKLARLMADEHMAPDFLRAPHVRRQYLGFYDYDSGRPLMRVRLLCRDLYREDLVDLLPDLLYYGPDACLLAAWYDPASKRILDFGGVPTRHRYPRERHLPPRSKSVPNQD